LTSIKKSIDTLQKRNRATGSITMSSLGETQPLVGLAPEENPVTKDTKKDRILAASKQAALLLLVFVAGRYSSGSSVSTNTEAALSNASIGAVSSLKDDPTSCYDGTIDDLGAEPSKATEGILGLCEGDCDNSAECEGDLECFDRDGFEPVPGCRGNGEYGYDYCVLPGRVPLVDFGSKPDWKLGRCQGDCDDDEDCEGSLMCFQRSGDKHVPGCKGPGEPDYDYCVNLNDLKARQCQHNPQIHNCPRSPQCPPCALTQEQAKCHKNVCDFYEPYKNSPGSWGLFHKDCCWFLDPVMRSQTLNC
jgi:hypothetical protein